MRIETGLEFLKQRFHHIVAILATKRDQKRTRGALPVVLYVFGKRHFLRSQIDNQGDQTGRQLLHTRLAYLLHHREDISAVDWTELEQESHGQQ